MVHRDRMLFAESLNGRSQGYCRLSRIPAGELRLPTPVERLRPQRASAVCGIEARQSCLGSPMVALAMLDNRQV
jgi:hypothetical protein